MKENCLFKNFTIITPDKINQVKTIANGFAAVNDGIIVYAGDSEAEARAALDGQEFINYDGKQKILLPAMANTHGHIAMTLFRNQADDRNLHDWLYNVIFSRESRLTAQTVLIGTRLGLAEMIRSGTGAAADMYYFNDAVAQAALEIGFRLNLACDTNEKDPAGSLRVAKDRLAGQMRQYQQHPSGLLRVSMLVHSVYLYEADFYLKMAETAKDLGFAVQVHIAETQREVEDCQKKYGCRPPRQLEMFGFFATPTIAAHCVHLDEEDRRILAHNNVLVSHNPSSNLKLGSGIADLPALINAGVRVSLGTDGAASNNNLDLYREMRLASFLAKGISGDAALLPAGLLLDLATRQGMEGLGFADSGRIEAGCQADIQIIDTNRPSMTPLGDPAAALVYSADTECVESLMVAGSWLMRKRELLTIDEEKLLFEARRESEYLNGY